MGKTKERKFIEIALSRINFSDPDNHFKNRQDVEDFISECKEVKQNALDGIEILKSNLESAENQIEIFEIVLHQIKVAEMEDLNKGKKIIIT